MDYNIKRFNINNYILKSSYVRSFSLDDEIITLNSEEKSGMFITGSLDSAQKGMKWGRLVLNGNLLNDYDFYIYVMASDDLNFQYKNTVMSYDEFFASKNIDEEDKIYILSNSKYSKISHNFQNVLLLGLEGRYLWFALHVKYASNDFVINNIFVYFPGDSLIKYFPEIYKKNKDDFFERYLSIFSSLNKDYQRRVDDTCKLLDVDKATNDVLKLLSTWLGLDVDNNFFNINQLRLLIKNAKYLNQYKGTVDVISKVVELFVGEKPFIVEQIKVKQYADNDNWILYQNLYGVNRYEFFVILNRDLKKEIFYQLKSLINLFKPARTKATILFLRQKCQADNHCYIDINSKLTSNTAGVLDKEQCLDTNIILT